VNATNSTFYTCFGKRWFDVIVSFAGLLLLSPLLLLVAIAVRLSSPGPALFSQTRTGQYEKPFRILKFRSMKLAPAGSGPLLTVAGDSRITPFGRWLRKTKIDELPQLINVLVGQMSLVGPRPEVPLYTARYSDRQKRVLLAKPGVTSLQINFDEEDVMAGCPDKESFYLTTILPAKLEIDLMYSENIRFLEDQRIILQTVAEVFRRMLRFAGFASFPSTILPVPGVQEPTSAASLQRSQSAALGLPETDRRCE